MKKIISVLLAMLMLSGVSSYAMTTESEDDESYIWDLVSEKAPNDLIAATIMACAKFESGYKSNAIGEYYYVSSFDISAKQTEAIDNGMVDGSSRDKFRWGRYCYGYGLLQWNTEIETLKLYDYARASGSSIGDADMQISFIFWDLQNNWIKLWNQLLMEDDLHMIVKLFSIYYMGTTYEGYIYVREGYANDIYEQYAKEGD